MKFSVIHPTARVTLDFEHLWWKAASSVFVGCDNPAQVEYIVVVHESRRHAFNVEAENWRLRATWNFGRFTVVTNFGRDCLVDQCNAGLLAAQGEIIAWNQDDMRYPSHWDTEIAKLVPDRSKAFCVQARTDGSRKDLLTLPTICTRVLHEQIGLLPTEYESMYSDDEWSMKAWKLAGVIPSNLYFQHFHPVNGTAASDAVYELENRQEAYRVGLEVFEKRKALGFPRVPFPGENPLEVPTLEAAPYPILALAFLGKEFSGPWVDSFLAMGMELKEAGVIVKRFRGYAANVYQARIDVCGRILEDADITGEDPKYVLWMDGDNVAAPGQLTGLIKFLDHYPGVDAVAGWCWVKKAHRWTTSVGDFWDEDGVHLTNFNLDALFAGETPAEKFAPKDIEQTGFPFLLMRFESMRELGPYAFRPMTKADLPAYFGGCPECEGTGSEAVDLDSVSNQPCSTCKGTGLHGIVQPVADHWFCGEDTAWCLQAKKAGFTIVVDPGCKVGHLKLQLQEPLTTNITPDTPAPEAQRSIAINGAPVHAPQEYERSAV